MTPTPKKFTLPEDKVKAQAKRDQKAKVVKKSNVRRNAKIVAFSSLAIIVLSLAASSAYGIYSFHENYVIRFQSPIQTPMWIEKREVTIISPLPQEKPVKSNPTPTPEAKKKTSLIPVANAQEKPVGKSFEGHVSHYSKAGCLGCDPNFIMANGEQLDDDKLTLAVPPGWLPMNTQVRVTNLDNGKSVIARVTDTGGFLKYDRIADLTLAMARELGTKTDISTVRIEAL